MHVHAEYTRYLEIIIKNNNNNRIIKLISSQTGKVRR